MATITISDELFSALEAYAQQTGESVDELVERLLRNFFEEEELTIGLKTEDAGLSALS